MTTDDRPCGHRAHTSLGDYQCNRERDHPGQHCHQRRDTGRNIWWKEEDKP